MCGCGGAPVPAYSTTTAPVPDDGTWRVGTAYTPGTRVTYRGQTYECRHAHTAINGWEPTNTPTLWMSM